MVVEESIMNGAQEQVQPSSRKLTIALVHVLNKEKKTAMNKDLNGGFGTCDEYGNKWSSKIIKFIQSRAIRLPVISFAFLQAIFKQQGHNVCYYEITNPFSPENGVNYDIILIYGTIVDYKNENAMCKQLKSNFPNAIIGFFGPFPSRNPSLFPSGDFVLDNESEGFFLKDFKTLDQLKGFVHVTTPTNLDELPTPDYDNFPIENYSYTPAISKKPFLVLQASKGCPYSCRFYCPYGEYQGAKIRQRSAESVVNDIIELQKKYNVQGIQFRDPTFGLNKNYTRSFCAELRKKDVHIIWGMETRTDLLNKDIIKEMYDVGLRNINIGVETSDIEIAKKNKRILVKESHQEEIINYCKEMGIHISAFYILGLDGDTEETIQKTIKYAIYLNTPLARFSVSTPYPGTGFYTQLEKEDRLLTKNFEDYNQFNLVYAHKNLTPAQVRIYLENAYKQYYFRISYFLGLLSLKLKNNLKKSKF